MAVQAEPQSVRDRKAIFRLCNAFGLTRPDRLEVATVLLDRNVDTFSALSPAELARVRDALEGAALVCTIQIERRRGERV